MASGNKLGFKKSDLKKLVGNIDTELSKMKASLSKLDSDLEQLQRGSDGVAYWSGERAYTWVTNALKSVNKDKKLLGYLNDISDAIEVFYTYGKNW